MAVAMSTCRHVHVRVHVHVHVAGDANALRRRMAYLDARSGSSGLHAHVLPPPSSHAVKFGAVTPSLLMTWRDAVTRGVLLDLTYGPVAWAALEASGWQPSRAIPSSTAGTQGPGASRAIPSSTAEPRPAGTQGPGASVQGPGASAQGPGASAQGPGASAQGPVEARPADTREEIGSLAPGARGQGAGARGQGAGARGQGAGARVQGPGARGQGPGETREVLYINTGGHEALSTQLRRYRNAGHLDRPYKWEPAWEVHIHLSHPYTYIYEWEPAWEVHIHLSHPYTYIYEWEPA